MNRTKRITGTGMSKKKIENREKKREKGSELERKKDSGKIGEKVERTRIDHVH